VTIPISVSIHPGVKVGSTDLNGASATLTITIPSLFGGPSGPPDVQVAFNTSLSSGADLLSNFTNAGPNEILGMLSQITDFFASMANQQVLQTTIPFTHVTIGSALDYARAFKHEILDPLFKSGDATHPDANNDGKVDINDFNFGSIQGLLDRLSAALGLPAGTLKSDWGSGRKDPHLQVQLRPPARHRYVGRCAHDAGHHRHDDSGGRCYAPRRPAGDDRQRQRWPLPADLRLPGAGPAAADHPSRPRAACSTFSPPAPITTRSRP